MTESSDTPDSSSVEPTSPTETESSGKNEIITKETAEAEGNVGEVVRLLAVVFAGFAAAVATGTTNTVLVVLCVVLMIMIHELGHFATAKWSGMKVTEYFLGFGPRVWSIKRGETEYGIKAIPAGGYVKIIGMNNLEEVDPEDEPRTYRRQPYRHRLLVAVAGSFMHFVMAFAILIALYGFVGLAGPTTTVGTLPKLQAGSGPAEIAGLQAGDKIISVDGTSIDKWDDVSAAFASKVGVAIPITVERNGQRVDLSVTPIDRSTVVLPDGTKLSGSGTGFIGVGPKVDYQTVGFVEALTTSTKQMGTDSWQVLQLLGQRFSPSGISNWFEQVVDAPGAQEERKEAVQQAEATNQPVPASAQQDDNRLVSPVGLVNFANHAADSGIRPVLALLFSINLFVGIFNMVPLLPFDGGHVAVATYERIRSRKGKQHMVDFAKLLPVSYAVLFILVVVGLSALWLDILDPLANPFQ